MATFQLNSGLLGPYKSPYNFISTYDRQMKEKIRHDKPPAPDPIVQSPNPLVPLSHPQTTSELNQQNGISKQMLKSRDVNDLSQRGYSSDRRDKSDSVQEQENLTARRSLPNSDSDNDFAVIDGLLSSVQQKSTPTSANWNDDDDDDDFPDIDELLSSIQQKGVPATADPNSGGMAEIDGRTRSASPTDSTRSTAGSGRDPIILSDGESGASESETDCPDPDVDCGAKHYSDPLHIADGALADGDGFGAAAAPASDCLATGHQADDENDNSALFDKHQLCLSAERSITASLDPESETHHARKQQVNAKSVQGSMGTIDLDVAREVEVGGCDALVEGNTEGDNCAFTKRANPPAPSDKNQALESAVPEPPDDRVGYTQTPRLGPAATSPHQSDLKNGHLRKRLRRGALRHAHRKHPHTVAPIRPALTDLDELKSRIQITIPDQERKVDHIDQEEDDDSSADDPDDVDYSNMSSAAGSNRRGPRHPRKRTRRTKDREHNNVESLSTLPSDDSCQSAAATSSSSIHESEEIPVHGFLTLKSVGSKVVYCLTFSQELLPRSESQGQRQLSTTDPGNPESIAQDSGMFQASLRHQKTRRSWTQEEDIRLCKMKKNGHSWDEIHAAFPRRTKATLQVRYSTKLKDQR